MSERAREQKCGRGRERRKSTERKIIETIKNRLNWGCENGNPQFFHLLTLPLSFSSHILYMCLSVIFGMERYKIFGAVRQWKTRMEQQKKCDGNVMDWIVCVFVAKQSQIDAVILVANRKCNISKVSYRIFIRKMGLHTEEREPCTVHSYTARAYTHKTQYDINIQMRDSKKDRARHIHTTGEREV